MLNFVKKGLRALPVLFFISIACANSESALIKKIRDQKLWNDPEWKRLLHVHRSVLLYERSEASADSFFLSSGGRYNFQEELFALADGVSTTTSINDKHPICRFPARTIWLHRRLNIPFDKKVLKNCRGYQRFFKLVQAEKVNLVFSSYYLESPASAFGHTLLRLSRPKNESYQDTKLLDMGINSAAQVTTNNAILYAFLGIIGGFDSNYSAIPYFYKVREYNDFESRDLWSYELDLEPSEIERMINHLWEVGNTSFTYYYFTQNCSYNLLTLLEVADFNLELISKLPFFYTLPSHTIQIIKSTPGLVKEISVDPSLRKKFDYYFNKLSAKEKKILIKSYKNNDHLLIVNSAYSSQKKTELLDTLIYYVDYKHPKEILLKDGEISIWKNKILISRSKMNARGYIDAPFVPAREAPHRGHGPRRINISYSRFEGTNKYNLGYRLSLHSLMDPIVGQPELATLEFGDFAFSAYDGHIKLSKFDIFEIMTLNPWTRYHKPFSFRAKIGYRNEDILCAECTPFSIDAGAGITFFNINHFLLYSFLNAEFLMNRHFDDDYAIKLAPEVGLKFTAGDLWSIKANVRYDFSTIDSKNYWNTSVKNYFYIKNKIAIYNDISYIQHHDWAYQFGINCYF